MGIFSKSCSKCGSLEHAYEDCPHGLFSRECSKCGSLEHAYEDCPHGLFLRECTKCGSREHAYEDCPHGLLSHECSKCGSLEHAYEDCPHGLFSRECSKCGSREHAYEDCPHGLFSRECSKCGSRGHTHEDCQNGLPSKISRQQFDSEYSITGKKLVTGSQIIIPVKTKSEIYAKKYSEIAFYVAYVVTILVNLNESILEGVLASFKSLIILIPMKYILRIALEILLDKFDYK